MKKKYLASLTIASVLLPAFMATQTGVASETDMAPQEASAPATEEPAAPTAPAAEVPMPVTPIPEPVAPAPETPPAPEVPSVETAPQQKTEAAATPAAPAEQPVAEAQEQATDVNPLDVEPFPPNVPTDTAPAINLIPVQSIRKGTAYDPMAGVTATDTVDGDITSQITYTGSVDVNTVGEYPIIYSVTNSRGKNTRQLAIIHVIEDNVGMYSIELADFSLPIGSDYIQAIRERIVIKDEDGSIVPTASANILVSSHHSTDKAGQITVEVVVLSHYNTVTKKMVNITITDDSAVEESVRIEANDVTLAVGDTFDPYAYAKGFSTDASGVESPLSQASDASSTGLFVLSNDVDTSKAGAYNVTYQARNDSGTVVTKTIAVTVTEDKSDRLPVILVEDKVMYVGDKLTTDMIMGWATTEDPNDFITGFKVMNGKIKVKLLGNTLVEPGVHEIKFSAMTKEGKTAEKTMTLTVKDKEVPSNGNENETPKDEPTKGIEAEETNVAGAKPTGVKKISTVKTEQKGSVKVAANENESLPETGESTSNVLITLIGLIMSTGIGVFLFKKKDTEKNA